MATKKTQKQAAKPVKNLSPKNTKAVVGGRKAGGGQMEYLGPVKIVSGG